MPKSINDGDWTDNWIVRETGARLAALLDELVPTYYEVTPLPSFDFGGEIKLDTDKLTFRAPVETFEHTAEELAELARDRDARLEEGEEEEE